MKYIFTCRALSLEIEFREREREEREGGKESERGRFVHCVRYCIALYKQGRQFLYVTNN